MHIPLGHSTDGLTLHDYPLTPITPLIISGAKGSGKTSLAKMFIKRLREDNPHYTIPATVFYFSPQKNVNEYQDLGNIVEYGEIRAELVAEIALIPDDEPYIVICEADNNFWVTKQGRWLNEFFSTITSFKPLMSVLFVGEKFPPYTTGKIEFPTTPTETTPFGVAKIVDIKGDSHTVEVDQYMSDDWD